MSNDEWPGRSVAVRATGMPGWSARLQRLMRRGTLLPYLFISPFFFVFFAFFAYPLCYSFVVSLHSWTGIGPMHPVGWANYRFALTNQFFWEAVTTTALMWVLVIPVGTIVSLLIAVVWNLARFRARHVAILLYLLPAVISVVAVSLVFKIIYDPSAGPLDATLAALHLPTVPWLTDPTWARVSIALVRLWATIGLGALFYFASLQGISQEIYDASLVDGCGPFRQLWSITVPLLAPTTLFMTVLNTLGVFGMFAEPSLITNDGGPNNATTTVGLYLFHLVNNLDFGTASAVSFLTTMGMMLVSVILFLIARRWAGRT